MTKSRALRLGALILSAVTCSFTWSQSARADGDPEAGRRKAATCMGCHGIPSYTNVYPTYNVPKLGGQHAKYIVSALQSYKESSRDHSTMHAQAESLSEQDMEDVAAWFATQGD